MCNHQAHSTLLSGLMADLAIWKQRKLYGHTLGVTHDTECTYGDQVLSNNTTTLSTDYTDHMQCHAYNFIIPCCLSCLPSSDGYLVEQKYVWMAKAACVCMDCIMCFREMNILPKVHGLVGYPVKTSQNQNIPSDLPKHPIFGESKRPKYIFTIFNQSRDSKHFFWTHWSKCPKVKLC